ncbi:hypothetical protein BGZ63DRAFT_367160 [Mariannaea sp. PMI_226]|nr:hypothetical protein BGZ63DRAFT_367160 [Mariannaea sp. PMI_226]
MAVLLKHRRITTFLPLLLLLSIAFFCLSRRLDTWNPASSWRNHISSTDDNGILSSWIKPNRPVRIAIVETAGVHDEVTAALVHAFGGYPDAELQLYFAKQRYGMDTIISNFSLPSPIVSISSPPSLNETVHNQEPHVLVSTTCELDLPSRHMQGPLEYLLSKTTTHLFCVVHHADLWAEGKHVDMVRKWVAQDRVDFITLSQHTADFLVTKTIPKWNSKDGAGNGVKPVLARILPPVFPVNMAELENETAGGLMLAMQGNYESGRRDYEGIFQDLVEIISEARGVSDTTESKNKVELHLVGHGQRPKVPEEVEANVIFDSSLSYPDFYTLISHAFSVLPAFSTDTYYDRKASSSIPAALIAGAPLVANEKLLAAYSYYPREAAWVGKDDERELNVVERVINERDEYLKKKAAAKAACTQLIEENRVNVRKWIEAAKSKTS